MGIYSVSLGQESRRGANLKNWYYRGHLGFIYHFPADTVKTEVKELIEILDGLLYKITKHHLRISEISSMSSLVNNHKRRNENYEWKLFEKYI